MFNLFDETPMSQARLKAIEAQICLGSAKKYGYTLKHVKEQTPEICLEAVRRNGLELQFVKEQNPEIFKQTRIILRRSDGSKTRM
jgi:hypothetical protein